MQPNIFRKILPLMMLELYKEIELEYVNSTGQDFLNVIVTDKNVERRGDGRRMVFHCQGIPNIQNIRVATSMAYSFSPPLQSKFCADRCVKGIWCYPVVIGITRKSNFLQ